MSKKNEKWNADRLLSTGTITIQALYDKNTKWASIILFNLQNGKKFDCFGAT